MYVVNNERNANCELGYDRTLSIATMTFNGGNGAADDSLSNYKVIRVGDIAFEGHVNKAHAYGRFVLNDAGDGLMSPRFSCLRPIVEQRYSFWKYYIPREESMRPILVHATKSGTMMNELVPDDLMHESLLVPCLAEQEVIGNSLSQLDHLITLHQRKRRKESFGRHPVWEQRKLCELADRYKELVPTPCNGYVRMGVRSHAKGTFLTEVEPGQQIEEHELSKVKADNLVVNIVFAWEHAVAITSVDDAKALVSHRFPQFSFHDDMEPGFFRYAILDEAFRWHLWLASPSGAGRNKTLNVGTMLEYEFSVPKKAEQAKIAAFFDRLDDLITLHQ